MTRLDLIILNTLNENNATQKTSAMTVKEISEKIPIFKYNTLYINIKKLCDDGYLKLGYKDANAHSYYLSIEKGLPLLEEEIVC